LSKTLFLLIGEICERFPDLFLCYGLDFLAPFVPRTGGLGQFLLNEVGGVLNAKLEAVILGLLHLATHPGCFVGPTVQAVVIWTSATLALQKIQQGRRNVDLRVQVFCHFHSQLEFCL
jgi:hypothetical protein